MPTVPTVRDFAGEFLGRFVNLEKKARPDYPRNLDRTKYLLSLCGDPQAAFPVLLVAGSKGKGSTAVMMASIIERAGLKTGLYTSPHLLDWRERIRCGGPARPSWARPASPPGGPIGPDAADEIASFLEERTAGRNFPDGTPTYFEIMTAMALVFFRTENVDAAVLEVGLGGEYDATNASEPALSVITPLGFEHQEVLGNSIGEIARAKSGVMREDRPVVAAAQRPDAMGEIRRFAAARRARLRAVADEIEPFAESWDDRAQRFSVRGPWGEEGPFHVPLLGRHQIDNALTAILAAGIFLDSVKVKSHRAAARAGLECVVWPGRVEKISDRPAVVLDGAHTPESAEALAAALRRHFRFGRLHLILAMMNDKDPARFIRPFEGSAASVCVTRTAHERSFEPSVLRRRVAAFGGTLREAPDFPRAFAAARLIAAPGDAILVTGSLYLVAEAKRFFQHAPR